MKRRGVMKKILSALILMIYFAVSLVAFTSCGGDGGDEPLDEGCAHIWDEPTVDTAATCKKEGTASVKCTACGEKRAGSEVELPKIDHNYVINSYFAPSCVAYGLEVKTCRVCGYHVEIDMPPTDIHTWSESYIIDLEPTSDKEGYQSIKCVRCREAVKPGSGMIIPATGEPD